MKIDNFFAELKRRNVYKVAITFAVVAWLLIQAASILLPTFEAPSWVMKVLVVFLALGFVISVMISWAFEATPEGLKRTESVPPDVAAALPTWSRRKFATFVVVVALLAAGLLAFSLFRSKPLAKSTTAAVSSISQKSIAVLPFENLSDDKSNAYFADGIQDEVITRLAKIGGLRVISRSSMVRYKTKPEDLSEVASQLGVAHFVEGSVQKVGDRVRINVQLIRADVNDHVWAEIYDRKLADIFAVQSELASAIANALHLKLSGRERAVVAEKPTENVEAYDAYLRGIDLVSRPGQKPDDQTAAIKFFEEAVRLDPKFTQAWAALSAANAGVYFLQIDASSARKEAAREAAETAARLDPKASETLLANAYYRYHIERDYKGARDLFEKIRHEMPSNSDAIEALARIARRQSRWKESIRLYEEAAKLDPRDAHLFMDRAWTFSMLRERADTLRMIEGAEAIAPNDPDVLENKATFFQWTGNVEAARAVLEQIPRSANKTDIWVLQLILERRYTDAAHALEEKLSGGAPVQPLDGVTSKEWLGWIRTLAGDAEGARKAYLEAKAEIENFRRDQPGNIFVLNSLGNIEAGLGNKESALREGERAISALRASEDPVYGPIAEENLAAIEVKVGQYDRALERIERLLRIPYGAFPLTQARLRLEPVWDPLRQHPRFKALVEGPEPKTIYN